MNRETESDAINRGGFYLFLAAITLATAYIVWPFAAPLLWATLAAIMFQPLYQWVFARMSDSPNRAALLTLLFITVAILLPGFFIGGVIVDEAANVVTAFQDGEIDLAAWAGQILAALPAEIREWLDQSGFADMSEIQERAQQFIGESAGLLAQQAVAIGGGVFGFVLSFIVGLYVTYFLLRDGKRIAARVMHDLPMENSVVQRLSERFLGIVRATIKGSVVVGLVQGALGALTFWIVGLPSVVLFGLLMAIFSLLPAVGTGIVWVPAAIWLLATGATWEGLFVVFSGVVIIGMADNVLRPILVGRETGIPDWIILITTLGGIATLGLSGVVLGPLVAGLFLAGWSIVQELREPEEQIPTES
ncbi:AI-2E family transporter [Altererythrobacter lutimaris]|uniref:AI-2E family transporter n=1 Tax=Altererythrobacter lutimaris TaxID=2743979 RepID=A0A850HDI4_9SPHN|nr:AI-2E family transporter [Altererythrobacter lutimaris]NVE95171.1 AI-2E family transporter [Altererythrobacter lutimaris]